MALQIGLECAGLLFAVKGHGGLDFPWAKGGRGGDRASVVTCKAFLEVCRKSRVVMVLHGYVGEDIDIEEGYWK